MRKHVTLKCLLAGLKNSFLLCSIKETRILLVSNAIKNSLKQKNNEKGIIHFVESFNNHSYGTDKRTFRGT